MGEIKKIFYSMGEVSEMLDVNPSLLRFWEKKFDILRPKKNKKGNRMFTPEDVRNLKIIYHLVKENGMTLAGAQKRMKQSRADIERDMELSERLHAIKALLLEVKQRIDDSQNPGSAIIIDGKDSVQATDAAAETNAPVPEPEAAEAETTPADDVSDAPAITDVPKEDTAAETDGTGEEDMSDEDLEWEIETAFAAMNETEESEDEYEPDMQESALFEEDDADEIFIEEPLQQYDEPVEETSDEFGEKSDDADFEPYDEGDESGEESYSIPEDEPDYELNDNPEDEPEDEPETETETETILEEGMLFAVQAIKPKPVTEETIPEPQEPEPPVKENEKPRIIEQTLF